MNKKIISIICATVLTLCAVVGGMVFTGMQTNASGNSDDRIRRISDSGKRR